MQVGLWQGVTLLTPLYVKVNGRVIDCVAELSVLHGVSLGSSTESVAIQAMLPNNTSISGLEIKIEGRSYVGKVEAATKAHHSHSGPLAKFICQLGVLPLHTNLEFTITYVTQLSPKGKALHLYLPKLYSTPSTWLGMEIEVDIVMTTWFIKQVDVKPQQFVVIEKGSKHTLVGLQTDNAHAADEIIIELETPLNISVVVEKDITTTGYSCMIGFPVPELELRQVIREVILVISASCMTRSDTTLLVQATQSSLHSLSAGTYFNIYVVLESGSYEKLFIESTEASQSIVEQACLFVTETLETTSQPPCFGESLADIYNSLPKGSELPRQLIFLTSYPFADINAIATVVQQYTSTTHVSVISIDCGSTENYHWDMAQNIANLGKGNSYIVGCNELAEVLSLHIDKIQRACWGIRAEWGAFGVDDWMLQAPALAEPGDILFWCAFVPAGHGSSNIMFHIGDVELPMTVTITEALKFDGIICRSVATSLLNAHNVSSEKKSRLGLQYGLATPYISFVISHFLESGSLESKLAHPDLHIPPKRTRRVYSYEFIMQYRGLCTEPPEGLPPLSILLKGKPNVNNGVNNSPKLKNVPKGHRRYGSGSQTTPQRNKTRTIHPIGGDTFDDIYRKVTGILNKITPEKFTALSAQLASVKIPNLEVLSGVMGLVFDKAVLEPNFSTIYAELCKLLSEVYPSFQVNGQQQTCRRVILNRCQKEFENRPPKVIGELTAEKEEQELKRRRYMLGNVKFIGELFKLDMLTEKIMHECINRLLSPCDTGIPEEEDLETLSRLMRTVGQQLEGKRGATKPTMDDYYTQISSISKSPTLSSRIRFMLQDLLELRQHDWVPRRKDNTPQTIAAVHADAEREEQRKAAERELSGKKGTARDDKLSNHARRKSIDRRWDGAKSPKLGADNKGKRPDYEKSPSLKGRRGSDVRIPQPREKPALSSSGSLPKLLPPPEFTQISADKDMKSQAREMNVEEIESQIDIILEEYFVVMDTIEAVACIREINVTGFISLVIARAINFVLERNKPREYELLNGLFDSLVVDGIITSMALSSGFESILGCVEDLDIDVPFASKVVAGLIGHSIAHGHLPLSCMVTFLAPLVASGKASSMVGWILHKISQEVGETKLSEWFGTIDIIPLLPFGMQTQPYLTQYLHDNNLSFLVPTSSDVLLPLSPHKTQNLEELLSLQTMPGNWDLTGIAEHFGLDISLLRSKARCEVDDVGSDKSTQPYNCENVWATCLVLIHLQHEYNNASDKWRDAANKGRSWLDIHQASATRPIDVVLEKASQFLIEHLE